MKYLNILSLQSVSVDSPVPTPTSDPEQSSSSTITISPPEQRILQENIEANNTIETNNNIETNNTIETNNKDEKETVFEAFLDQHFPLAVIGSVVGGLIILVLLIAAIFSLVMKLKKGKDSACEERFRGKH